MDRVRAERRLGGGRAVDDDDERLGGVGVAQGVQQDRRRQVGAGRRAGVAGGQDAPVHRRQVRREQHRGVEVLLDLGGVAVVEEAVGVEVLVDGAEGRVGLRAATGAGDPAGGVDDHAGALDEAGVEQRRQGERGGRDVAAGRGDEPGADQLLAVALGQAVGGLGEQGRLVVLEAVPLRVQRGVLEPVGRRQVDDAADPSDELRREGHRRLVREAEEHDVEPVDAVDGVVVGGRQLEVGVGGGQRRVQRGGGRAGLRIGRRHRHVEARVAGQQAQQLGAGVARRPDDAGPPGGAAHRMIIQMHCMDMQWRCRDRAGWRRQNGAR